MSQSTCPQCRHVLTARNRSRNCEDCNLRFEIIVFFIGLLGGAFLALVIKWGLGL